MARARPTARLLRALPSGREDGPGRRFSFAYAIANFFYISPFSGGGGNCGNDGDVVVASAVIKGNGGECGPVAVGGAGVGAAGAGPVGGGGEQRSYETVVGPTFEGEARAVLSSIFREVCPWVTKNSDIISRRLDRDGNAREGDLMCYLEGDSLRPCAALPHHGVRIVEVAPPNAAAPPLPAVALERARQFSPTDVSHTGPHKYFVGEAYCGADRDTMREKVAQLESLCGFLRQRWEAQHEEVGPTADLTQVVGAAALVFSAGDSGRRAVLGEAVELVSRNAGRNLLRLIAAGRLFVVVLEKGQSPLTFFQHATAAALDASARQLKAMADDVAAVKAGVAALLAAQQRS